MARISALAVASLGKEKVPLSNLAGSIHNPVLSRATKLRETERRSRISAFPLGLVPLVMLRVMLAIEEIF